METAQIDDHQKEFHAVERFGEYARRSRERERVSLRSIAEALGLSAPYLSDIERGNRNPPTRDVVARWARLIDEEESSFVRRAEMDRKTVEVPVNHNPANAELAMAFARKLPTLSDEQRAELERILSGENES